MAKYQDYGLEGRIAVVTGAGTGVGRSVAEELAKGGAKLALFGRRLEKLEETKAECLKYTDDVLTMSVDVGRRPRSRRTWPRCWSTLERWTFLSINAGFERRLNPGESFWENTLTS